MMRYPELMIAPMREELHRLGARGLRTAEEVDAFMDEHREGTAVVIINSICGCASGIMRPAVAAAVTQAGRPRAFGTVFAGADLEATQRAREHITGYPPSSPAIALFREGEVAFVLERTDIQGHDPAEVAQRLAQALEAFEAAEPAEAQPGERSG